MADGRWPMARRTAVRACVQVCMALRCAALCCPFVVRVRAGVPVPMVASLRQSSRLRSLSHSSRDWQEGAWQCAAAYLPRRIDLWLYPSPSARLAHARMHACTHARANMHADSYERTCVHTLTCMHPRARQPKRRTHATRGAHTHMSLKSPSSWSMYYIVRYGPHEFEESVVVVYVLYS